MSQLNPQLTTREAAVLTYIKTYCANQHFPPSLREIAAGCHIAHSTVTRYLELLEVKGYLVRKRGTARGIQLLDNDS